MNAGFSNRLAKETSPYLLQHQHNPVDWYPWGPEAFEVARQEKKAIFLSVGYSTCYWCHVMERQCFENEAIAEEMNRLFVNIKVDREERPDVDQLYMTAVQVLTHQGGWPMSVFLTEELRPFYGGTYFPPTDQHGRPGFVTLIRALEDAYKNRRADVEQSAAQIVNALEHLAEPTAPKKPLQIDGKLVARLLQRSVADYDPQNGGFGSAPKFPRQTLLELLLVHQHYETNPRHLKMLTHTLDALAEGGIRDQLGGGFHRYSTDEHWLVPHFEIMLYDNAMLGWCYVEAFRQTGEQRYAVVARGIFDFILREMTSPEGPFYTAFDAEVDGQEGLNYLWTREEVRSGLTGSADQKQIDRFCRIYGLDGGPNFADPHHGNGRAEKNILYLAETESGAAILDPELKKLREILYLERLQRKQPLLDTKIITSWNGLMIRALAFGGKVLGEQRYLDTAANAADFLLSRHRDTDGGLRRTSRDGVVKYAGFIDDYAFLIQGLLALHDAGGGDRWQKAAESLAKVMIDKFGDRRRGGFYFNDTSATDLIVRQKVGSDSPLPSGNGIAAMVLLELGRPELALAVFAAFAGQLSANAESMSAMLQAMTIYLGDHPPFTVSAGDEAERPATAQQLANDVVTISTEWSGRSDLKVRVVIAAGFHINSRTPEAGLVATQLSSDIPAEIEYPTSEFAGEIFFIARFKQPPASGSVIQLALRYQACNDNACYAASTKSFEVLVP